MLLLQLATLLAVAFTWHAFQTNSWSNRLLSYVINKALLWWYPIYSIDGHTPIPTCPYRFPDGGGSTRFVEGEIVSRQWAEKYGPIYRIWIGLTPEIIVTRPSEVKAAFKDSGNHRKALNLNGGWVMGDLVGDGVGLISQGHWKRVHAVVSPPFTQRHLTYVPLVQARVERHFTELGQTHTTGQPMGIKPAEDLKLLPFWVISDLLYGELPAPMVTELLDITHLRTDVFQYAFKGGLSLFWVSKFFSPQIRRKLHVFHHRWAEFNRQAYHRAKASSTTAAAIVPLYKAVQEGRISTTELMHTLDEALFANIDVTIGSFSWIPPFLAANADVQIELRAEITKARAPRTQEDWATYLASSSTLLASCINESARLKPVTNYTYAQSLPTDRDVGGYLIPRGINVVVDTNALNLRDPSWGEDRGVFRPRRFLEEDRGEFRYRFWRFGFGPRQCIAQALADTILKVLVAHTVENYRIGAAETTTKEMGQGDAWFKVAEQEIVLEPLLEPL